METRTWREAGRLWMTAPVTTLCFDDRHELLWLGRKDGFVESYDLSTSPYDELHCNSMFLQKHSSFRVAAESRANLLQNRVCSVLPIGAALGLDCGGVMSLSSSSLSIHTSGGFCVVSAPQSLSDENQIKSVDRIAGSAHLTCASFMSSVAPQVVVGCRANVLHVLDAASGLRSLRTIDYSQHDYLETMSPRRVGCICLDNRASRALVAGGADGKVRIFDSQLRSHDKKPLKEFNAFSGSVVSVACKGDTLVTVGNNQNPRPGGKGIRSIPDSTIKVYDLRIMRQLPSCHFTGRGDTLHMKSPNLVEFLPGYSNTILAAAPGGAMLFLDLSQVAAGCPVNPTQYFHVVGDDGMSSPGLECMSISSSGQIAAMGCGQSGSLSLWSNARESLGYGTLEGYCTPLSRRPHNDRKSLPLPSSDEATQHIIQKQPPFSAVRPPSSYTMDISAPTAHYKLCSSAFGNTDMSSLFEALSSSHASKYTHWSRVGFQDRKIIDYRQNCLHPLLSSGIKPTITESGLPIGTLDVPALIPHRFPPYTQCAPQQLGLYFGRLRDDVWLDGDPRNESIRLTTLLHQQQEMFSILTGGDKKYDSIDNDDHELQKDHTTCEVNKFLPTLRAKYPAYIFAKEVVGRYGFVDEAYLGARNRTIHSGLENLEGDSDNLYSNSIIQLLYFIPELRKSVLNEQFCPENYSHDRGLAIELGFLVHMLDSAAKATARDGLGRSVQPTNFLRAFRRMPNIVALGLTSGARTSKTQQPTSYINDRNPALKMAAAATAVAEAGLRRTQIKCNNYFNNHNQESKLTTEPMRSDEATRMAMRASRIAVEALYDDGAQASTDLSSNDTVTTSAIAGSLTLPQKAEAFLRFLLTEFDQELSEKRNAQFQKKNTSESLLCANGGMRGGKKFISRAQRGGLADSFGWTLESHTSFINTAYAKDNSFRTSYTVIIDLNYPSAHTLKTIGADQKLLASPQEKMQMAMVMRQNSKEKIVFTDDFAYNIQMSQKRDFGLTQQDENFSNLVQRLETHCDGEAHVSKQNKPSVISFAEILRNSLCKEQRVRAFSETAASQKVSNYQYVIQKRYPKSIPEVLAINCAVRSASDDGSIILWRGTNLLGGPWLPRHIQIQLQNRCSRTHIPIESQTIALGDNENVVVAELIEEAISEDSSQLSKDMGKRQGFWSMVARSRNKENKADPAVWLPQGGDVSNGGKGLMELQSTMTSCGRSKKDKGHCQRESSKEESCHCSEGNHGLLESKQVKEYELFGIVSHVKDNPQSENADGHLVCHVSSSAARINMINNGIDVIIQALKDKASESRASGKEDTCFEAAASSLANVLNRAGKNIFETGGDENEWILFNDFIVEKCTFTEVLSFHNQPWREPCCVIYRTRGSRNSYEDSPLISTIGIEKTARGIVLSEESHISLSPQVPPSQATSSHDCTFSEGDTDDGLRKGPSFLHRNISSDVFDVGSLSLVATAGRMSRSQNKTFRSPDIYTLPEKGHLIAIDTEFVTVAKEDAVLNSDGSRTVNSAARQGLKSGPNAQDVSNLTAGDLYAPTLHKDSLRLLLSLAAGQNYSVFQADIQNAFLQGKLKQREFIRPPEGMKGVPPGHLLELLVPVYGLRYAPASFVQALAMHLTEGMGFRQLTEDPCVFINEDLGCFIGAYIDDLVICLEGPSRMPFIMSQLRERFTIKEGEGAPVDWLLGIRVRQNLDEDYISIDQELAISKLANALLSPSEMETASSVRHPVLHSKLLPRLPSDSPDRITDKKYFHTLSCCGSLLHIANSVRCDVASSVGILCRHATSYGEEHIKAAKRIVRYLYATRTFGLVYRRGNSIPNIYAQGRHPKDDGFPESHMRVFVDSDFAMDETRRSTMGSVTLLNGAPISWMSTLGKTVATSTCEAEVNAAVAAAKDAIHLRSMLRELGFHHGKLTLHEDNSAAISQGSGGLRLVRNAKHYTTKLRWLQQVIADGDIGFAYTPTKEQLADCFTKPNDEELFLKFRERLVQDVSLLN